MGTGDAVRPRGLLARLDEAVLALEGDLVVEANGAAGVLFGRSRSELIGRTALDLLGQRARRRQRPEAIFDVEPGGSAVLDDGSITGERADGDEFPMEVRVNGDSNGRLVLLRDITERVETQDALRRGPERLDEDQPDARVGSWEWDIPANVVRWSDQLYRIYGLEPGSIEPSYERFIGYVHPDDRDSVNERNQKAFADHQPFKDVKRVIRADGTEIQMRTQGEVICDADGNPVRMIGVCEDVTDYERDSAILAGLGGTI